MIIKTII